MVKGLAAIQAALEAEGIEFTDDNGVPGVRLHPKKRKWKWAGPYLWVNCRPAAAAINPSAYGENFSVRACAPQIGDCQKIRHDQRAHFQRVP
jgi:hypothetical protein